jgi:tRNA nucleotidyltransferase (CCA-adding enzyme)
MFTRRDMEKTKHGGYSHAPVKAYMSNRMIYVASDTPSEELIRLMIKHDIGRLPVKENEEIIGIVTRTDLIHLLHHNNNML